MSIRLLPLAPLLLAISLGCSGESAPPAASSAGPGAVSAAASAGTSQADSPIAEAAYEFMDAVFANDIARATQRLTPQAVQNLQAQDKRFEWGAAAAKLEIGRVEVDPSGEAAVQCYVSQTTDASEGQAELLCVLRKVGDEWLVYGVAWQGGEAEAPQIVNFEEPVASPAPSTPRPQAGDRYVESPAPQIPPSTPRTAASPATGLVQ